jgi:hypothetical protein
VLIFNVVKLSIGLDFVKNIDNNWKKRLVSIDFMKEENNFEKINIKYNNDENKSNIIYEKPEYDYWQYWKKRYSIIR